MSKFKWMERNYGLISLSTFCKNYVNAKFRLYDLVVMPTIFGLKPTLDGRLTLEKTAWL